MQERMKKRNVLYGYRYENGEIAYEQTEKELFLKMAGMYLDGMSLGDIARTFNEQKIEYSPSGVGWNKSRIMRLLSDERYTGDDRYPAIISEDTHQQILDRRDNNSCLVNTDFDDEIYRLAVPVICPDCGGILKRKTNYNKEGTRCLKCPSCGYAVFISDEDLISTIKEQMTTLVDDPSLIDTDEKSVLAENKETTDLNRDIEWSLERMDVNTGTASDNIRKLASMRYRAISEQYYISQKLKWDFIRSGQFRDDSPDEWKESLVDLANRTIKEIHIGENGNLIIILHNEQSLTKGA